MATESPTLKSRADDLAAGLDALESPVVVAERPWWRDAWRAVWPVLAALAAIVAVWQVAYLLELKPSYALPSPAATWSAFVSAVADGTAGRAVGLSLQRAAVGFAMSVVLGVAIGVALAASSFLRRAFGPIITGLQTLPSVAWVPAAIIWFQLSNAAIYAVILLGAVPSIVNGLLAGTDQIPPLYLRVGQVLGARGWTRIRFVLLPAALPGFLGGLKQGWAFAWRSLMAGELLVIIGSTTSLGVLLSQARELNDAPGMISYMIVILIVGIVIDQLFGVVDRAIRERWGLDD